jgi:hypothetical protein
MPFNDLPEGQTHHEKDSCIKCHHCTGHYDNEIELHQHQSDSIECDFKEQADNNDLTNV